MVSNDEIAVYVAAKRTTPPKLPMREALILVAIECVYEPKMKEKGIRRRLNIVDLLKRRKTQKNQGCTLYSHENNAVKGVTLSAYLDNQGQDWKTRKRKDGATVGASTLSSLTMTSILHSHEDLLRKHEDLLRKKGESLTKDFLDMESFVPIDAPSLAPSDVDDDMYMEDMTMSTYALIGGMTPENPPGVIITSANEKNNKWWYEESTRVSPLVFEDPNDAKDFEKAKESKLKQAHGATGKEDHTVNIDEFTIEDSILFKEVDVHSQQKCMEDLSTIVDSTCSLICPNGVLVLPENHDLKLTVENDEDLESLDRRQNILKMDTLPLLDYEDETNTKVVTNANDPQDKLFKLLGDEKSKAEVIKSLLDEHPEVLKMTRPCDGRIPLHVLCDRTLPSTELKSVHDGCVNVVITNCIKNISSYRMVLKLIAWSHTEACGKHDKNGDLPCHLLGRQLLKWTSLLQNFILHNHLNVIELERMTMVSKIITECIDIVVRPITTKRNACASAGSVGRMLPLHLSILFGSSMDVFRLLLETSPEASSYSFKCHEADAVLPISLLEHIKADQKQFQDILCNAHSLTKDSLQWHTTIPSSFYEEDLIQRSDLLFCFHPTPLQINEDRIIRIEKAIKSEAKQEHGYWAGRLSPAAEAAWLWMCARFKSDEQELEICDAAVERIISALRFPHIKKLLNIKSTEGETIIKFSRPRVRKRLLEAKSCSRNNEIEEEKSVQTNCDDKFIQSTCHRYNIESGASTIPTICRSIFAVTDDSIPTSFVVFPFPIEASDDGNGMLVAERSAALAVKFANFMLHETSPEIVLQCICQKIKAQDNILLTRHYSKESKERAGTLSKLYRRGGWLYFIDELSGKPIAPVEGNGVDKYPIHIKHAARQVETLLPLMRMGMILMRQSQIPLLLSKIIVQSRFRTDFQSHHPSWLVAATGLISLLSQTQTEVGSIEDREGNALCNDLSDYVSSTANDFWDDASAIENLDWSTEISLLQLIFESAKLNSAKIEEEIGIQRIHSPDNSVAWTTRQVSPGIEDGIYHDSHANEEDMSNSINSDRDYDIFQCETKEQNNLSKETQQLLKYRNKSSKESDSSTVDKVEQKLSELHAFFERTGLEDDQFDQRDVDADDPIRHDVKDDDSNSFSFFSCKDEGSVEGSD